MCHTENSPCPPTHHLSSPSPSPMQRSHRPFHKRHRSPSSDTSSSSACVEPSSNTSTSLTQKTHQPPHSCKGRQSHSSYKSHQSPSSNTSSSLTQKKHQLPSSRTLPSPTRKSCQPPPFHKKKNTDHLHPCPHPLSLTRAISQLFPIPQHLLLIRTANYLPPMKAADHLCPRSHHLSFANTTNHLSAIRHHLLPTKHLSPMPHHHLSRHVCHFQPVLTYLHLCRPHHLSHLRLRQLLLADSISPPKRNNDVWIDSLKLSIQDRAILEVPGKWLNDKIIYAAHMLLKSISGDEVDGFQDTQLGKNLVFSPVCPYNKFIQILHVDGNHWILVSNIRSLDGGVCYNSVCIYDSLKTSISLDTKKQICSLVKPKEAQFIFDVLNVQHQTNLSDCGLFAIAFATELVYQQSPVFCDFNTSVMRSHLLTCFESGVMKRFPLRKIRRCAVGKKYVEASQSPYILHM